MYYLPTDYLVLTAIRDKKVALDALLEAASAALPYPLPKDALAFSLGKLCAGGYIESYALTEKGAAFFKNNKKFLESRSRADARMSALLCAEQTEEAITPYEISDTAYTDACNALRRKYAIPSPDLLLEADGDDFILRFGNTYAEQEDADEHVGEDAIKLNVASLTALCDAFVGYCSDGKLRKCCLYANGAPAYVATVSTNEGSMRTSICKILYNRQRFIGKKDGDLDYAQCGDCIFDRTANDIDVKFACAVKQIEHLLGEQFPYAQINALMAL